jgi:hypothetical protein
MTGYTAIVTIIRSWNIFSNFVCIISYTSFPHCVYFTIRVIKRIFIYNLTFEEDSYSKSHSGNLMEAFLKDKASSYLESETPFSELQGFLKCRDWSLFPNIF